jgi:hypothetical protein
MISLEDSEQDILFLTHSSINLTPSGGSSSYDSPTESSDATDADAYSLEQK